MASLPSVTAEMVAAAAVPGGAMDAGKGGFGGKGGEVVVDGNWNVTTAGDKDFTASGPKVWAAMPETAVVVAGCR